MRFRRVSPSVMAPGGGPDRAPRERTVRAWLEAMLGSDPERARSLVTADLTVQVAGAGGRALEARGFDAVLELHRERPDALGIASSFGIARGRARATEILVASAGRIARFRFRRGRIASITVDADSAG